MRNAPLFAGSALGFEFTSLTRGAPVTVQFHVVFDRAVSPNKVLTCWTPVFIGFGVVNEIRF
jgi:hypothetical protein